MNVFKQNAFTKDLEPKEINLKAHVDILKRRFWVIILFLLIGTAAGYYITYMNNQPVYETSTRVVVDSDAEYMNTLMVMIKDPIIMEGVKETLELSRSSESIANSIEVERIEDSQVILIKVLDKDPIMSAQIANTTAATFKSEIVHLLEFEDVQLLSQAQPNPVPLNENNINITILFILGGLIIGIGLVYLWHSLDGSIKNAQEAEEILEVPALGTILNMKKEN